MVIPLKWKIFWHLHHLHRSCIQFQPTLAQWVGGGGSVSIGDYEYQGGKLLRLLSQLCPRIRPQVVLIGAVGLHVLTPSSQQDRVLIFRLELLAGGNSICFCVWLKSCWSTLCTRQKDTQDSLRTHLWHVPYRRRSPNFLSFSAHWLSSSYSLLLWM